VIFVHSELEGENCTMLTDRNASNLEMLIMFKLIWTFSHWKANPKHNSALDTDLKHK